MDTDPAVLWSEASKATINIFNLIEGEANMNDKLSMINGSFVELLLFVSPLRRGKRS